MNPLQRSLFDPSDQIPEENILPITYSDRIKQEAQSLKSQVRLITYNRFLALDHDTSTVTTGEYSGDRTIGNDNYQVILVNSEYQGTPKQQKNIPSAQRLSKVGARFSRFGDTLVVADLEDIRGTINKEHEDSDALIFLTFAMLLNEVHQRSIRQDPTGYANLHLIEFTSRDPQRFQEMMKKVGIQLEIKVDEEKGRRKGRTINPDSWIEPKNRVDEQPQEPVTYIIDYSELSQILQPLTQSPE